MGIGAILSANSCMCINVYSDLNEFKGIGFSASSGKVVSENKQKIRIYCLKILKNQVKFRGHEQEWGLSLNYIS